MCIRDSVIVSAWAFWLVATMDLGEFSKYRTLLKILVPAAWFLSLKFVDEFLAVRALGILLLLLAEPVFEVLKGWQSSTFGISEWDQLPAAARDYVLFLEAQTGVEAGCISTGPERTQTVCRPNSRFAAATK